MNEDRRAELLTQLNQLEDERESLLEELDRYQEDGESTENIEDSLLSIERTIGELEEELELLR